MSRVLQGVLCDESMLYRPRADERFIRNERGNVTGKRNQASKKEYKQ
jgi:hypothetical protein